MKEALLYDRLIDGKVKCRLCAHGCKIAEGSRGICGVRENQKGVLSSLVYGKVVAEHVDPIEKKPFFNFLPGTDSYSIATVGCNFRCVFCQNWEISQGAASYKDIPGEYTEPEEVVRRALERGCRSIAYTYNEPTIFFEYAFDVSKLAKKRGLFNLYVTNGFMSADMLGEYSGFLDAANVDLKSFSEKFYKETCGARLEPVLDSLRLMKRMGVWVEVTTLLIPGRNDSPEELSQIAAFIAGELGPETPWHISRFHPDYKLTGVQPTDADSIHMARRIGFSAGLRYVYAGNLPGDEGENTLCYKCNMLLVRRRGFSVLESRVKDSMCPKCGARIDGRLT